MYRRYLGRSVDAQGRLHYAGILQKWRGRQRVLTDIQQSAEARRFADYHRHDRAPGGFWARVYSPLLPDALLIICACMTPAIPVMRHIALVITLGVEAHEGCLGQ